MKYQIVEIDGKYGCKDDNDRWILIAEYNKMVLSNNCAICWKNNKVQVYSLESHTFLLNEECEDIREDKDGYFAFKLNGKWGVISTTGCGKIVLNNYYDDVKQLNGHLYSVHKDDYYEIANSNDCYVRHIDSHPIFYGWNRLLAKKDEKYGFINSSNNVTIPFIYDEIVKRRNEDSFDVRIGDAWGILSIDGRETVRIKYKNKVFDNNKSNYYKTYVAYSIDDWTGSLNTNIVYDRKNVGNYTWKDSYNRVRDARSGRMGVISRDGREIVPTIYTFINIVLMKSMPKDWKGFLSNDYPEKYSETDIFLFKPSVIEYATYDRTEISSGLYDISGNLIVPVGYESLSYKDDGFILASNYQGQQYEIYNIRGGGKPLIRFIDRVYIDSRKKRFLLFGVNKREYKDHEAIDFLDYCIPIDYSLKTILKGSDGEQLQVAAGTQLADIPEEFRIPMGGIEVKSDYYSGLEYSPVVCGNSIIYKKDNKMGVYYLNSCSSSPLYDELFDFHEDDLFLVKNGNRSGLYYKGHEILNPIYYGISSVYNGFCFIIKENYNLFDIDFVNINNITGFHINVFRSLSKDDVDIILQNNFLYFIVRDNTIYFNKECSFPFTNDFANVISHERFSMKDKKTDWFWGIY